MINQNIKYHLLHEQEYDKIRTIVELTDCKFGLSANGLSGAENDELLRHVLPVGKYQYSFRFKICSQFFVCLSTLCNIFFTSLYYCICTNFENK